MIYLALGGQYATKKALREAVKAGARPEVVAHTPFGTKRGRQVEAGRHPLCGPSEYSRKWYATVEVEDGHIVKVVS